MTNSSSDAPRRPGEFELIAKYFAPLAAPSPGAFGLADDAAFLRVAQGDELVVTVDTLIEGVHFLRDDPPEMIAAKALRVNLSDLAAKTAAPVGYLLALSLPQWADEPWVARFSRGLAEDQKRYSVILLGGDTTATPGPLAISITALGTVPAGAGVHRSGATPGDLVFVSGTIGDAGAGLTILRESQPELPKGARTALVARYRLPEPRLGLGRRLAGIASAALDVSDGLIADLNHIAEASGVRIAVDALLIPLSSHLVELRGDNIGARTAAATAGDDYEIAFTAPAKKRDSLTRIAAETGVAITEIGRVERGGGTVLVGMDGQELSLAHRGYVHF
jgi:thiamine-monophosphate kinase